MRRRIDAPPATIFALVTDPAMHVEIDGSGMLEAAPNARRVTAVGDTFDMDMDREPLGDIPLGKYKVRNHVTRIEPDAVLEWNVGGIDMEPFGHVYGYELAPDGGGTMVTHYIDWTGVPPERRGDREWPIVPLHMLERSLENLEQLATKQ